MVVQREAQSTPKCPNEAWSLDFIHNPLSGGAKFRALTVVDVLSREGLAGEVGPRLRAEHVVEVRNRLVRQHGRGGRYLLADTDRSSPGTWSTFGLKGASYEPTLRGAVSRPTTHLSRCSTARYEMIS